MVPTAPTSAGWYSVLYPTQLTLMSTCDLLVGITKSPLSLLTPPVTRVESSGLSSAMFAYITGCAYWSTILPMSLFPPFCVHSTKMLLPLSSVMIRMG
ncbi:hypothetical protein [Prevotella phocaeensis]|uniref:hypothetical protein n=1 Tax=Prevotella phocaeensis TaxID=1776388 RepID=UPI001E4F9F33|nr:hypothetical protein [Prevotella phocaeensis]